MAPPDAGVRHPALAGPVEQRPALWRALERFVTVQIGGVHSWTQLVPMQAAASG
ncbi:hypothetical protein [Deinococcus ficus]|uniref:hypothetical protein n=1 Tax=Deinococcus ficus TaxID=317577 RepID=UPI003B8349C1